MSKVIIIEKNKSLQLKNILIFEVFHLQVLNENNKEQPMDFSMGIEITKMANEIQSKGAQPVGPLIQFSGTNKKSDEDIEIKMSLMLQADRFIQNLDAPYTMEPVISVKNCMYTRFTGYEDDITFAYQKIQVEAYENEIKLTGNTYTVFLDSDEETGTMTADIFMESEHE